ncbi:MAG: VTT domain-containing protein [Lysobacterales bacterium]|jgi:undecaprenyl-diphosphatase
MTFDFQSAELRSVLDWVAQHHHLALSGLFLVAAFESLAVVGLLVPGAAVMIAAGSLIALGSLDFWPTLLVAVAGAITGDGISFWLGHHYRERLRTFWPFHRHPQWLSRGEDFFQRHGGKSILFGRFIGPVRPIIPAVAGMLGMRPTVFLGMNVLSALAWGPAYLLPGVAFGASLALAGAVAARLAVLLLVSIASAWALAWLVRRSYLALSPRAVRAAEAVLSWGNSHPRLRGIFGGVLDPARPESKTLLLLGVLLIAAAWLFLSVLEGVVTSDPLVRMDQSVFQFLQGLRTPWGDRAMVLITELGDGVTISIVAVAVLAWFCWQKQWRTAGYWVAAIGFGEIAAKAIKLALQRPRPIGELYGGLSTYAFPSGHATMSMVAYGFLAALIASQVARQRRWAVYAAAVILISAIAASRLYLGAHWLSDVIGGLSLGLTWICLLAIAYFRHPLARSPVRGLRGVALTVFVLAAAWQLSTHYSTDLKRYEPRKQTMHHEAQSWWQADWRQLPVYRVDIDGDFEQPINLQWAGDLDDVRRTLRARGWRKPVALSPGTALHWLSPAAALKDLPLLPQVHDGRDEVLQMTYPLSARQGGSRQAVLRLWKSDVSLDPGGTPLWLGSVALQKPGHIVVLTVPVGDRHYDRALSVLARSLKTAGLDLVQRQRAEDETPTNWKGGVVLIRSP